MTIFKRLYDFVRTPYTAWLDLREAEIELHNLENQYQEKSLLFTQNMLHFTGQNSINNNFIFNLNESWKSLSDLFLLSLRRDVFWKKAYFGCIVLFIPALVTPFTMPLYGAIVFILALTSFTLFAIKKQYDMYCKIKLEVDRMCFLFLLNATDVNKANLIQCVFNLSEDFKNKQNSFDKTNNLKSITHQTQGVFFNTNPQFNYMPVQIGQQQGVAPYTDPNHEGIFHMDCIEEFGFPQSSTNHFTPS